MISLPPRLSRPAAVLALIPLLVLAGGQGASFATGSDTPTASIGNGGNVACDAGLTSYKLEGSPVPAGSYSDGTLDVRLSDVTESTFAFTANLVVDTLIVKGSDDAVVTAIGSTSGTGAAPQKADGSGRHGTSNITFCYRTPEAAPTSAPTAAPSPSASVTSTPEPTEAPAASASPSATSSPEPTEAPAASASPAATNAAPSPSTPAPTRTATSNGGNVPCPEGTRTLKIDSDELRNGRFVSDDGQLVVDAVFSGDSFSFTSDQPVTVVIVKGGPDAEVHTLTGPVLSATGLTAGPNPSSGQNYGISNVQLCYVPASGTAPTGTPAPSVSPEAEVSPTSSPAASPSVSPEAEVSPTSSPTGTPTSSPTSSPTASPSVAPEAEVTPTASVEPTRGTQGNGGNLECLTGTTAFKIDSSELRNGTIRIPGTDSVLTISDLQGLTSFDVTSELSLVEVIVKGGPAARVYTFTGPASSGNDLLAPLNPSDGNPTRTFDISNVTFCFTPAALTPVGTPSPTVSPKVDATPTSSPTSSPASSPAASPISSQFSSPAASPAASPTSSPAASPTSSPAASPSAEVLASAPASPPASPTAPAASPSASVLPTAGSTTVTPSPSSSPTSSAIGGNDGGATQQGPPAEVPGNRPPAQGKPIQDDDDAATGPTLGGGGVQSAGTPISGGSTNPATADGEGAAAPQADSARSRTLPFTGVPALTLVSLALALVVVGVVLTSAGRRRREARA